MPLTRYRLLVFQGDSGSCRSVPWWSATPWLLGLVAVLLTVSAFHLWSRAQERQALVREARSLERVIQQQHAELLRKAHRAHVLHKDVERIRSLNGKLAVMLSLEPDARSTMGMGAPAPTLPAAPALRERAMGRQLHAVLDDMAVTLALQETMQQDLLDGLIVQEATLARIPSIWPVRGRFASPFGYRVNPVTGRRDMHKGIDITADKGTPILAPADGVVTFAERFSSYGLTLEITHTDNTKTRYAHTNGFNVEVGTRVKRGDVVAFVGNTGRSTGPHLHYEVHRKGRVTDPMDYILN